MLLPHANTVPSAFRARLWSMAVEIATIFVGPLAGKTCPDPHPTTRPYEAAVAFWRNRQARPAKASRSFLPIVKKRGECIAVLLLLIQRLSRDKRPVTDFRPLVGAPRINHPVYRPFDRCVQHSVGVPNKTFRDT